MNLQALAEHPFELLVELERRARVAIAAREGSPTSSDEWVGIGFRLGAERFVTSRADVREVLPIPEQVTRVPGAKPWLRGIANLRGQLLTVVDLKSFLGAGAPASDRQARVLVVASRDVPTGLIVDEVIGFRRFGGFGRLGCRLRCGGLRFGRRLLVSARLCGSGCIGCRGGVCSRVRRCGGNFSVAGFRHRAIGDLVGQGGVALTRHDKAGSRCGTADRIGGDIGAGHVEAGRSHIEALVSGRAGRQQHGKERGQNGTAFPACFARSFCFQTASPSGFRAATQIERRQF